MSRDGGHGAAVVHPPADVLVVGAGLGGALASMTLAEAGLRVVCLEQGGWVRPEDHPHASPDWEWQRSTLWNTAPNARHRGEDYPVDSRDEQTLMWNGVGGSTVVYTAAWPRFRPSDFRKGTEHGLAPDWPITYEDLAPWYEAHDRIGGASGLLGDPAMPPREPFQTPPIDVAPLSRVAARGFERLGWHYWPFPDAIISQPYGGRLPCNNCGACQSGCPRGSIHDASVTVWPRALAAGADLRPFARAHRVVVGDDGRAVGALYRDRNTGATHLQPAGTVILAANGVGTARLLLLSADERHPDGLANSSGQVGRHLMHHGLAMVEAWVDDETEIHKGAISGALICEEFAETDPARGFVNGFTIHVVRMNGAGFQANGSHSGNVPPWGADHHAWFRRHFGHGIAFLLVGDDLPLAENRVTLSDTLVDGDGLPAPRITYRLCDNDRRLMDFAVARAVELAEACGAWEVRANPFTDAAGRYTPPAWHLLGTCRMGTDPATSVVDPALRAWDVPNLYVMDGSVLPTGAAVNPTSTIGAVVLRAASALRDELTAG